MTESTALSLFPLELLPDAHEEYRCRPFVKWAGGKTQLLRELVPRVPKEYSRYVEPFVGGGALLFALRPQRALILDVNRDLMNAYAVVKSEAEKLITELGRYHYDEVHYYSVRDADRLSNFARWGALRKAGRFLFLNKTCYNGLYRVNSQGFFNVPFGRYVNPTIVDADNLRACSAVLQNVEIRDGTFLSIEHELGEGDFVYLDPPYVPLSATSSFTGFSRDGFDLKMQKSLFEFCCRIDQRGVRFMLSNSSAPFVKDLYARFQLETVSALRAVNSRADKRGRVDEVIVRNYQ